jgi:hypothetical protein
MSTCCLPYTQPFSNVATLAVTYSAALKLKYGTAPLISVFFYDEDYNEYLKISYPSIRIAGGVINFDFGGLATGYIKIY